MSKGYFSYTRVSTVRQGQTGTSLAEQREAIWRYAERWRLNIVREFEETETAAKSGRPVFLQMLSALKQRKADGVIIHKIDRSARNLRDWSELGEMIDGGIEVHFANEQLDLDSRGGRLSADIQAVVAADFIRNLRQEVRKGFYGRIKQGLYPMPAPAGYIDCGPGQPKAIDPIHGPLIRKTFELYATGRWGINRLVDEMSSLGLRNRNGRKITRNGMSHLLHNHFYTGLIKIKKSAELFEGQHQPIVSRQLFDKVQLVLAGKNVKGTLKHDFPFQRLLRCASCENLLIAETHKGYVYYRCQTRTCDQKSIREEMLEAELGPILEQIKFTQLENRYLRRQIAQRYKNMTVLDESTRQALALNLEQLKDRRSKLTDAYLDGIIDQQTYTEKKNGLVLDEQMSKEKLARIEVDSVSVAQRVEGFLELANNAYLSYKMGNAAEKRDLVQSLTSNFLVRDKSVLIKLKLPFQLIADRTSIPHGRPHRDTARTLSRLLSQLFKYFTSRKTEDEEAERLKPVPITADRLKLAFSRANEAGPERFAA